MPSRSKANAKSTQNRAAIQTDGTPGAYRAFCCSFLETVATAVILALSPA
jgi:hypothetical protein